LFDAAVAAFERALKADPENVAWQLQYAELLIELNRQVSGEYQWQRS